LGAYEAQVDTFDGLTIREVTDRALASLAARIGQEGPCAKAAESLLAAELPGPQAWAAAGEFTAWWMGPDQWMVDASYADHTLLAAEVKTAVGDTASVTEQTDGWCRFDLNGPRCFDVLERLCQLDLRSGSAGDAQRCALEHVGVFLLCRDPGQSYSVLGPRSSAASLHHALTAAAESVL
jgi:sarcosine oxidase subunit gamma